MIEEVSGVVEPQPMAHFVETPFVQDLTNRSLGYLEAGFPVHFRGGAGTGKTTLALHVAGRIGRPVVLIRGDEEYTTSDLVGGEHGYHRRKVVDRFVSRVLKVEENMNKHWVDSRLTVACRHGLTLVYDEFTRSRPEANNIFLSILQEKILDFPVGRGDGGESHMTVHPEFRAIFTSNPEEYAGVYRSQDALRDRMITMDLSDFDLETEIAIVEAKSQLPKPDVMKIVKVLHGLREADACEFPPTVRGAIMIAKSLAVLK
ncbi:MAG: gas vesicle protein GvpN, partial [Elusimicrobia bacterium]|nr:gas vesicle protein GvpN [Elusimicrobiota bacterium]